jgi:hypothetical protein
MRGREHGLSVSDAADVDAKEAFGRFTDDILAMDCIVTFPDTILARCQDVL